MPNLKAPCPPYEKVKANIDKLQATMDKLNKQDIKIKKNDGYRYYIFWRNVIREVEKCMKEGETQERCYI